MLHTLNVAMIYVNYISIRLKKISFFYIRTQHKILWELNFVSSGEEILWYIGDASITWSGGREYSWEKLGREILIKAHLRLLFVKGNKDLVLKGA